MEEAEERWRQRGWAVRTLFRTEEQILCIRLISNDQAVKVVKRLTQGCRVIDVNHVSLCCWTEEGSLIKRSHNHRPFSYNAYVPLLGEHHLCSVLINLCRDAVPERRASLSQLMWTWRICVSAASHAVSTLLREATRSASDSGEINRARMAF